MKRGLSSSHGVYRMLQQEPSRRTNLRNRAGVDLSEPGSDGNSALLEWEAWARKVFRNSVCRGDHRVEAFNAI